jgi:ABC-type nitrate/sulfonate/bicarbonate transport system permease component
MTAELQVCERVIQEYVPPFPSIERAQSPRLDEHVWGTTYRTEVGLFVGVSVGVLVGESVGLFVGDFVFGFGPEPEQHCLLQHP